VLYPKHFRLALPDPLALQSVDVQSGEAGLHLIAALVLALLVADVGKQALNVDGTILTRYVHLLRAIVGASFAYLFPFIHIIVFLPFSHSPCHKVTLTPGSIFMPPKPHNPPPPPLHTHTTPPHPFPHCSVTCYHLSEHLLCIQSKLPEPDADFWLWKRGSLIAMQWP